jgi:cation transport ATPase
MKNQKNCVVCKNKHLQSMLYFITMPSSCIMFLFAPLIGFHFVYFDTSSIIITLILIGRLLESRTKEKESLAVGKLLDLRPRKAKIKICETIPYK